MIKKIKFKRGFTLLELLIVVAIIGILAIIFLTNFLGIRQRASDSRRKTDLRQIQAALELYRYDQGIYPASLLGCPNAITSGTTTYMQKIPCDPQGATYYNSGNYYYTSIGTGYTLCACLENTNDNQGAVNTTCSSGIIPSCNSGKFFFLQSQ